MSGPAPVVGRYRYEHTAALFDGTVTARGVDATFETAPLVPMGGDPQEAFAARSRS